VAAASLALNMMNRRHELANFCAVLALTVFLVVRPGHDI